LLKAKRVKDSNLRNRAQNAASWPLNEPAILITWHALPVLPRPLRGEVALSWLIDEGRPSSPGRATPGAAVPRVAEGEAWRGPGESNTYLLGGNQARTPVRQARNWLGSE
jgi:hypothetical protein